MLTDQDTVALLKADHRKVEELFTGFENAGDHAKKIALVRQICTKLTVHATIEEKIFYPACKETIEGDLLQEAYVEHHGAKVLISELSLGSPTDEFYNAKVKVLSELIKQSQGGRRAAKGGDFHTSKGGRSGPRGARIEGGIAG